MFPFREAGAGTWFFVRISPQVPHITGFSVRWPCVPIVRNLSVQAGANTTEKLLESVLAGAATTDFSMLKDVFDRADNSLKFIASVIVRKK